MRYDGQTKAIDISLPVSPGMLSWPTGRPAAEHEIIDAGDGASPRNTAWHLDSHAGAHIDAPLHWLPGGDAVEQVPLDSCVGPCTVAAIDAQDRISAESLPGDAVRPGTRLLLKTSNSGLLASSRFSPSFVALDLSAARALADARVALLGIDYLSVEAPSGDGTVHRTLLEAGVVVLEGIDLSGVAPGDYVLSALPVRLIGGEAAPVRAALWPLPGRY